LRQASFQAAGLAANLAAPAGGTSGQGHAVSRLSPVRTCQEERSAAAWKGGQGRAGDSWIAVPQGRPATADGRGGTALPWPAPTCYMDLRLQPWPARRWLPGTMRRLAPLPALL